MRLELRLANQAEWFKVFEPLDGTVFFATEHAIAVGTAVTIDLDVGGWAVNLRGTVVATRPDPRGIVVAIAASDREKHKLKYLNGFVRGALLNLREHPRLPIRLPVTYGAVEGPAKTHTQDINEFGLFLLTDKPLPETSQIHMLISIPGRHEPLSLRGKVSHIVPVGSDEPAGMGVVFLVDDGQRTLVRSIVQDLAARLDAGTLPSSSE